MDVTHAAQAAHSLPFEKVVELLGSDAANGIGRSEAGDRLDLFGRNELPEAPPPHPVQLFLKQFRSLLVIILLVAAALALAIWYVQPEERLPYDTIIILAIVFANSGLGFFQEYKAQKSLEKLKQLSGPHAVVVREGQKMDLAASELVPGDVMVLEAGASVLADARVFEASSLEIEESSLTGESTPVEKAIEPVSETAAVADRSSMVFAATAVSAGRGKAVVTATGGDTELGKIAKLIGAAVTPRTPLQRNLDQLGKRLGSVVLIIAAVVSITGLLLSESLTSDSVISILFFGVALAVAAIPEGLPAAVTGALALGTERMARRNAIVRKLQAVETLGSTSAICSDKTGTLTMGEMTVRQVLVAEGAVDIGGAGYVPEGAVDGSPAARDSARRLAMSAVLCNDSSLHFTDGAWRPVGTPTEAALLAMAVKLDVDYSQLRRQTKRVAEAPFSSSRKMMSVVVSAGGGGRVLHAKGAPEIVLERCSHIVKGDSSVPMDDRERQRFLQSANDMAASALRTLAVARRPLDPDQCDEAEECENGLEFLGLAGIADPPRPEAMSSIHQCKKAGIEVFMITGDHLITARAIATELGITGDALAGTEVEKLDDHDLRRRLESVRIFARVSPGHKVRIVAALQALGYTVAVTGDGVNDAPALVTADIGVAMGITGTDVAREAADMVLADDNFATIVAAVEEGRGIFANIRKFMANLLSSNAGEIVTLFAGMVMASFLGFYEDGRLLLPLLAVQILWINLVTDGLPALSLVLDPKEPHTMSLPPRAPQEPVINRAVLGMVLLVGIISGFGSLAFLDAYAPGGFFTLSEGHDLGYARTMTFLALALFQMYNTFNARRMPGSSVTQLLANRWLVAATTVSVLMMLSVIYIPAMQRAFRTQPVAFQDWIIAAICASSVLWLIEVYKAFLRRRLERNSGEPSETGTA